MENFIHVDPPERKRVAVARVTVNQKPSRGGIARWCHSLEDEVGHQHLFETAQRRAWIPGSARIRPIPDADNTQRDYQQRKHGDGEARDREVELPE